MTEAARVLVAVLTFGAFLIAVIVAAAAILLSLHILQCEYFMWRGRRRAARRAGYVPLYLREEDR